MGLHLRPGPYMITILVHRTSRGVMPGKSGAKRVREQVVVYMDAADRSLLEDVVTKSGLSKTEIFRRGLRHIAGELLAERKPGSAFDYLIANATEDEFPSDMSERHDDYLYGTELPSATRPRKVADRPKRARLR